MSTLVGLFVVAVVALLVNHIAAVALQLTGMSEEASRFEAHNVFLGVGLTSPYSTTVATHPIRRRIVTRLMLAGAFFWTTVVASLVTTFQQRAGAALGGDLAVVIGGALLLWVVEHLPPVTRGLERVISIFLRRVGGMSIGHDSVELLRLAHRHRVTELYVSHGDWVAERALEALALNREGILVRNYGVDAPSRVRFGAQPIAAYAPPMPPATAKRLLRADPLRPAMNAGKERRVRALLQAWRRTAVLVAREQWRAFYTTGALVPYTLDKTLAPQIGARRLQMVRAQVVAALDGYLAMRQDDFSRRVARSHLAPELQHQLHFLNRWRAWFRAPATMPATLPDGTAITPEARSLARALMRRVLRGHRRPRLDRIGMTIDVRGSTVRAAMTATHFPLWVRLSTLERRKPIEIPLRTTPHHAAREGARLHTVHIAEDRDGQITVAVLTDVTAAYAQRRAAYVARTPVLGLDWGLTTLFASDRGDLLGRRFLDQLVRYDRPLTALVRHRQRSGLRVRCPKYDRQVERLRGFLRSEIHRVLNRLVATHAPGELVVERLRFRRPELSRRMNRLVTNAGRAIVEAKLQDIAEQYGITVTYVNPAYSSQECSACHYVARENRTSQAHFRCDWCGTTRQADVNAARSIVARRSRPAGWLRHDRLAVLRALVTEHAERYPGRQGPSADPRTTNPYFASRAGERVRCGATSNARRPSSRIRLGASTP